MEPKVRSKLRQLLKIPIFAIWTILCCSSSSQAFGLQTSLDILSSRGCSSICCLSLSSEEGEFERQEDKCERELNEGNLKIRNFLLNGGEDDFHQTAIETASGGADLLRNVASTHQNDEPDLETGPESNDTEAMSNTVSYSFRLVAPSDGKIPMRRSLLPASLGRPPFLLDKLDEIYHANAHKRIRSLTQNMQGTDIPSFDNLQDDTPNTPILAKTQDEEKDIFSTLRDSLQDSGFQLLGRRDLDLAQALNTDYLFRLSITANLANLDSDIAKDFFPDRFDENCTALAMAKNHSVDEDSFLYDGRVLVFWRGYGYEVNKGRLLLPKIDYLQSSIVRRVAAGIRRRLNAVEDIVTTRSKRWYHQASNKSLRFIALSLELIPSHRVSSWATVKFNELTEKTKTKVKEGSRKKGNEKLFKLSRYGGYRAIASSTNLDDALAPFTLCEIQYTSGAESRSDTDDQLKHINGSQSEGQSIFGSDAVDRDIYTAMSQGQVSCPYDEELERRKRKDDSRQRPPMQLLKRVSINNLVDFSPGMKKNFLSRIFAKSTLVEPTYQEVVVIWRPLPPKQAFKPPAFKPPKVVYELADMFDIEGLQEPPNLVEEEEEAQRPPLEIRVFSGVPMANLAAALPKTKNIFRPADALAFDLVSIVSLLLVLGSQRFDNPRLDLLAFGSFCFWVFRTVIRYSNKLARYDLLVKKFLTSKITHRNAGALKYLATEASTYRATRAALVHSWLISTERIVKSRECNSRADLIRIGMAGLNELIRIDKPVRVDISAALDDLEDLGLISFSDNGETLESVVSDRTGVVSALSNEWASVFEEEPVARHASTEING